MSITETVETANETSSPCSSVQLPTDCLQRASDSFVSVGNGNGLIVDEIIENNVISCPCESRVDQCSLGADCEASKGTLSTTEL